MTTDDQKQEDLNHQRKAFCDLTLQRAIELMAESGAPVEMLLDRLVSASMAMSVKHFGRVKTCSTMIEVLNNLDGPEFDALDADLKTVN